MELCDTTLDELIKDIHNDPNLVINKTFTLLGYYIACHLFIEILKGVNCLHKHKPQILHLDLHSGNILLKKEGWNDKIFVRIADFGLAQICELGTKSQSLAAKTSRFKYKSSKILSNRPCTTKDDIYSLGMILEELFSIDKFR
jgi:serine/threonine-protein kinase CTR1